MNSNLFAGVLERSTHTLVTQPLDCVSIQSLRPWKYVIHCEVEAYSKCNLQIPACFFSFFFSEFQVYITSRLCVLSYLTMRCILLLQLLFLNWTLLTTPIYADNTNFYLFYRRVSSIFVVIYFFNRVESVRWLSGLHGNLLTNQMGVGLGLFSIYVFSIVIEVWVCDSSGND